VVHGIIRQLRPSALDHLGLSEALRDVVNTWSARHPDVACDLDVGDDMSDLSEDLCIAVYRLVQECLTNVARHSRASKVTIRMRRENWPASGEVISLTVVDNGQGLPDGAEAKSTRLGLLGMRERVQALNGTFELHSTDGLEVRVVIPVVLAGGMPSAIAKEG
jgi:signal transduction histidine kinase